MPPIRQIDPFADVEKLRPALDKIGGKLGGFGGNIDDLLNRFEAKQEPFRRAVEPLDLSFLDPLEAREGEGILASELFERFRRGRSAEALTRSFGRTGSRRPGVLAKTRADLITGSIGDVARRRTDVATAQATRRATLTGQDLFANKAFVQNVALAGLQAQYQAQLQEAAKKGGGFLKDFINLGLQAGKTYADFQTGGATVPAPTPQV